VNTRKKATRDGGWFGQFRWAKRENGPKKEIQRREKN
jgi:hypothetical protein